MRASILVIGFAIAFLRPVAAQEAGLPPAPESLVELGWSSHFAAFIAAECPGFVLNEGSDPRITAFLQEMVDSGINLENWDTTYSEVPEFNADGVSWLFERSNIASQIVPEGAAFCDIVEDVYMSDMLTGSMLKRVVPVGGS